MSFEDDVLKRKYLKAGEKSWNDLCKRVALGNKDIEAKKFLPAGSVLSNLGFGLSVSNCYYVPIKSDSIEGISDYLKEMKKTFSWRGGVGGSLEILRPKGEKVHNAAETSTGSVSFMPEISLATQTIAQNGRRGANILTHHILHPDSIDFINSKGSPEKVFPKDPLRPNYVPDISGSNISIKLTDDFMRKVEKDEEWEFLFPKVDEYRDGKKKWDGNYRNWKGGFKSYGKIKAKELFGLIAENSWKYAEPGVLFWDTVLRETPWAVFKKFEPRGVNPCITGDTIVAVADGRNGVPVRQLVEEDKPFPVYSGRFTNSRGKHWKPEIKWAIAFKSGRKKVITLELSDGSEITLTPDHRLALDNGEYVEAKDSIGRTISKFYSYSNKVNKNAYRTINSKNRGYSSQYRMIWEFFYGKYNTSEYEIDHIDSDSTNDLLSNLHLLTKDEHMAKMDRKGKNNPINKMNPRHRQLLNKRKNILANAKRYEWSNTFLQLKLDAFDNSSDGKELKDIMKDRSRMNVDLSAPVKVVDILDEGEYEDVYDLTVEDNHNFYVITKTDDERYLNSSGILIKNCGEQILPDYGNCLLGSYNLIKFVRNPWTKKSEFDFKDFKEVIERAVPYMDNLIDMNKHPIKEQNVVDKKMRKIGLGVTGLADAMAMMGLEYGSDGFLEMVEKIFVFKQMNEILMSIKLGKEKGVAPIWNESPENERNLYREHGFFRHLEEVYRKWFKEDVDLKELMKEGVRNISTSTVAPNGTLSIIGGNVTSGIEPLFSLKYVRKTRLKDEPVEIIHPPLFNFLRENRKEDLNLKKEELLRKYSYVEAGDLDWRKRVKVQSIIQSLTMDSISSTINLKEETKRGEIEEIYMMAWKEGLKGITIYRDKCNLGGILEKEEEEKPHSSLMEVDMNNEEDREIWGDILVKKIDLSNKEDAIRIRAKWKNTIKTYITVTYDENRNPVEIFTKVPKEAGFDEIGNFSPTLYLERQGLWDSLCRMISLNLQYGINLREVLKQLGKSSYSMYDLPAILKRALEREKKPLMGGLRKCPECGKMTLKSEGGCDVCLNCGYSKCS